MLVFFVLSGSLDIQILNSQPPRRLCKPHRQVALRPLFKKAHNFEFPPSPNLTPRLVLILTQRYSQLWIMNHQGTLRDRMLRTWPRITILNNYSPKWYREGKWHDSQRGFIHFHPIYYLKGDRALGNSILRNSSSECQNQDQHSFIARTNTDWNSLPNIVIEKQSVKAVCEHGGQLLSLKTLTPDLFIIIFFIIFCTLAL